MARFDTPDEPRDGAVLWALWAVLAWAPLPLASKRLPLMAVLVVLAVLVGLLACWAWRHHGALAAQRLRKLAWPLGLLAALALWMTLQTVPLPAAVLQLLSPQAWAVQQGVTPTLTLSLEPTVTRFYAALTWAFVVVFAVTGLVVRNRARMDRFAMGLVWIGVAQALLAIALYSLDARYLMLFFDVVHDRTKGTYAYHNHFAGLMELCLAVGIGLMLGRLGQGRPEAGPTRRHWQARLREVLVFVLSDKMRLRLMLVILVIALVLTRSRMGNTAFFAALLVTGLVALALMRKTAPAMVALIVSLIVVDVVVIGSVVGLDRVVERVRGTELLIEDGGTQESVEERQLPAQYSLALIRDFAWTGTGAGTYYGAYLRYRAPGRMFFDHAHNDYVELTADLGLVGMVPLGLLVLSTVGVALTTLRRRQSSLPRGIAFGVVMAVVALAIHSTVDFNLQNPANALWMVVVLALGWSAWALPSGREDTVRRVRE